MKTPKTRQHHWWARLSRVAIIGVVGVALVACAGTKQESPQLTSLTIGLTYQPDIQFAPIYVAAQQGLFEQAGLNVTIRHHGASESLFGALQGGDEDVVFAGGDEMLQARSQGVDVVSIATIYQQYPAAILVPKDSPITTVADLRGHSIGLPGEYGENWFALLLLLRQAGLTQDDVTVVSIGYTQQAALLGGKVDAVVGFTNNDAVRFQTAGFPVRALTLDGLVAASLGVPSAHLGDQISTLRAMWDAISAAMQICADDPDQALAAAKAYVPGLDQVDNQTAALATLRATTLLYGDPSVYGHQDDPTWESMAQFMSEAGLLGGDVDVSQAYTTAIVNV